MDIRAFNRAAWDKQVESGNEWTLPVSPPEIAAARQGHWSIYLTPTRPVPAGWFPELAGLDTLCLASGGGQQGPILAAAGANVTVFDNSPRQLAQDRLVAEREGLEIATVEGDMADLSIFPGHSFDLIVHPVSNNFAPAIRPVWREAFRVLRPGGSLLSGFGNPLIYIFDLDLYQQGVLQPKYKLPFSAMKDLPPETVQKYQQEGEPLEFSHTLEDQIGGQIEAGFLIAGFYEDGLRDSGDLLNEYLPTFIATRAIKPPG